MYYRDHHPPHFHAIYAEYEAQIVIETLEPLAGELPGHALRLVQEWGGMHRAELPGRPRLDVPETDRVRRAIDVRPRKTTIQSSSVTCFYGWTTASSPASRLSTTASHGRFSPFRRCDEYAECTPRPWPHDGPSSCRSPCPRRDAVGRRQDPVARRRRSLSGRRPTSFPC